MVTTCTHLLANQRVKAIRKVVLEDSNTMKDILDPSSVGFHPHHVLLLSISYATSTIRVAKFSSEGSRRQMCTRLYSLKLGETVPTDIRMPSAAWC